MKLTLKNQRKKFPYMNKNASVSSLMNEEYSYKEDNSNIDISKAKNFLCRIERKYNENRHEKYIEIR